MALGDMRRRSHWLGEALRDDDDAAPPLDGDVKVDVCIVGGGFTGLWTALRLKEQEPALDILIVEKDFCGAGASGRNGGFVLSWWAKLLKLQSLCGEEEGIRLAKASADAVAEIGRFADRQGIGCHFRHDGWLWTATNQTQIGAWNATLDAAERYQAYPFRRWSPAEVARSSGSDRHLAGVYEPTAASVQPALLARGLRRVALEQGIRICEETPLKKLERGRPPKVVTPSGTVTADKVILAMNAWSIAIPDLRKAIMVVASDVVGTAPIPERLKEIGWDDGMAISDGRMLVHYYRTTHDGRIAFGKGGLSGTMPFGGRLGTTLDGPSERAEDVESWLKWTYPKLADVKIDNSWRGPIDRSHSGLPIFGHLDDCPDVLYGAGFSGNGVGPTSIGGRILASLALEKKDEWAGCGLVRPLQRDFPPEPIRYVGGKMVCKAIAAKDKAEDEGRAPGALTNFLAGFAPAGLSPTKNQKAGAAK